MPLETEFLLAQTSINKELKTLWDADLIQVTILCLNIRIYISQIPSVLVNYHRLYTNCLKPEASNFNSQAHHEKRTFCLHTHTILPILEKYDYSQRLHNIG